MRISESLRDSLRDPLHGKPRRNGIHIPHGFALLAVLWIIIGISVLALGAGTVGRHASATVQREHDRIVGRWLAEGCLERILSIMSSTMNAASIQAGMRWRTIDHLILVDSAAMLGGCELSMRTSGRVVLGRASVAELDSLPGMSFEAVSKIMTLQASGTSIPDLLAIEGGLSPGNKALFDAHYAELTRLTTTEPDAWVVRSRAHVGTPPSPVNIEVRLVRAGTRAAVVRWVEW